MPEWVELVFGMSTSTSDCYFVLGGPPVHQRNRRTSPEVAKFLWNSYVHRDY